MIYHINFLGDFISEINFSFSMITGGKQLSIVPVSTRDTMSTLFVGTISTLLGKSANYHISQPLVGWLFVCKKSASYCKKVAIS